jgi:hypothetical protein
MKQRPASAALAQDAHGLQRIEAQNARQFQELDHIDAPLPALKPSDEGLILPKRLGKLGLGHAYGLALLNKKIDQRLMPW